jgi:hypothetical protein
MAKGVPLLIAIGLGVLVASLSLGVLIYILNVTSSYAPYLSMGLAAICSLMASLIVWRHRKLHPKDDYETQVTNLYALVRCQVKETTAFCTQIKDRKTAQVLSLICEDIEVFLTKVAEKKPNSRKSAATTLGLHLAYLTEDILPQYLEMQNAPRFFRDSPDKLKRASSALQHLEAYLRGSITLLEESDDNRFEIALKLIDPLEHSVLF